MDSQNLTSFSTFTLSVAFTINENEWADTYGLASTMEARKDIQAVLTSAAGNGSLADNIVAPWDTMREMAIIRVGQPVLVTDEQPVSVSAEPVHAWTDESAAAEVARLDESSRAALRKALRAAKSVGASAEILAIVREGLARELPSEKVSAVTFRTSEFDDGYFLTEDGTAHLADGTTREIEFAFALRDLFTNEYGAAGEQFALGVDPSSGAAEYDDYGVDNVLYALGVRKSWSFYGHWEGDRIVVESYVLGVVADERVETGFWSEGLWSDSASGDTVEEAQALAVAQYEDEAAHRRARDIIPWADAFGRWHVKVPTTGTIDSQRSRARRAIAREIKLRENNLNPRIHLGAAPLAVVDGVREWVERDL